MAKKITEKIRIWGIVQGVGFRPFVAKVAQRYRMKGQVSNIGGLVELVLTDTQKHITEFLKELEIEKPAPCEIVHIKREQTESRDFDGFTIVKSGSGDDEPAMIPADLSICSDCLRELNDPEDPRYQHPFISCMVCGPRYTIIDKIPYDRENTSMDEFPMCDFCDGQYNDIADRRYHAQTISCHDCGPQMQYKLNGADDSDKPPIEKAAALLREGRVVAFKSMGGYNLIANPLDGGAVRDLREIKHREQKPFAVMFLDTNQVRKWCYMDEVEEKIITSSAKPIVLLEHKSVEELDAIKPSNYSEIAKSRFIGAFLPSMGAQYMLLDMFGGPLIVTSANVSDMPIIKDEDEMFAMLEKQPLIEEAFYNDRKIRVSVDDSVVRVIDGQPQMIRRSKGYVPVPLYIEGGERSVFAAGGHLKNSFSVSKGPFAYVSQYFGDMDTVESQQIYETNVERMCGLFRIQPKVAVCDMHPGYYTTKFAERYAEEKGIPLIKVQHHHAHVASVMAEHNIKDQVIGVSFDGTGYGPDGAVWGGEFMVCEGSGYRRVAHLKYVRMIGGDGSVKEGWKSAFAYMKAYENGYLDTMADNEITADISDIIDYAAVNGTLDDIDPGVVMGAIDTGINTILSSSMGRLFDSVSAMLGICMENSYEGQCAMMLEDAAKRALDGMPEGDADNLALDFHMMIAEMIKKQCIRIWDDIGVRKVALTGGVFQNRILMDETLRRLREADFDVYYNVSVSPNDGGIALGQTYVAMKEQEDVDR